MWGSLRCQRLARVAAEVFWNMSREVGKDGSIGLSIWTNGSGKLFNPDLWSCLLFPIIYPDFRIKFTPFTWKIRFDTFISYESNGDQVIFQFRDKKNITEANVCIFKRKHNISENSSRNFTVIGQHCSASFVRTESPGNKYSNEIEKWDVERLSAIVSLLRDCGARWRTSPSKF